MTHTTNERQRIGTRTVQHWDRGELEVRIKGCLRGGTPTIRAELHQVQTPTQVIEMCAAFLSVRPPDWQWAEIWWKRSKDTTWNRLGQKARKRIENLEREIRGCVLGQHEPQATPLSEPSPPPPPKPRVREALFDD